MTQQWEVDFKAKLKQAESLLMDAERILSENGIQTPIEQPNIEHHEKISLPAGYIRRASEFRERYKLREIIHDVNIRSNIAYALQASDLINYFHNRYKITLSAGSIFYKISTAHIFSIIEALLYGATNKYHSNCCDTDGYVCKKASKCELYIKKANKYSFPDLVQKFIDNNVLTLTDEQRSELAELKGVRDRIHIWDAEGNELIDIEFTRKHYNRAIRMLAHIRSCLNENFSNYEARQIFGCPNNR